MTARLLIILTIFITLFSCKRECRIVKDTYKNGKEKVVHIYPNCNDTNYYKQQSFYDNGQLANEGFFKDGKKTGHFKSWYDKGQIEAEWDNFNGNEDGFIQCWYKNGQKKKEGTLTNGHKNGLQKTWHENGKQESEGKFIDGKRHGVWKYWHDNGEYRERNYINDTLNGVTTERLPDKRQVFGQYKNGKEVGQWIWKDSLGNLDQTTFYKDGVYDSTAVAYFPDGRKREEHFYKDGKLITTKKY